MSIESGALRQKILEASMRGIFVVISAAALICASAQIASADETVTEARAVEREVHGNDLTYHRHIHHDYNEHRHYAERHRYHHTYVQ